MRCEICGKKQAVLHIQQIVGREKMDFHLCEVCARKRGIASGKDRVDLSIGNLLSGLVKMKRKKEPAGRTCLRCGSTWDQIQNRKKLGCSECYTVFNKDILSVLGGEQKSRSYQGKYPKRLAHFKTYLVDVLKLKEGLKDALRKEDYEAAARLRDRIREMEDPQGEADARES